MNESDSFIYNISEYISNNITENITLKSLSDKFSISEAHLSRKFKKTVKTGLNEFKIGTKTMFREFFNGRHEGLIIFVGKVVDFVDFVFRDDENVALRFGMDVEKGKGFVVFVNFVTGNFTLDDFGKNARHFCVS